jgi:hypothetical protein
MGKRKGHGKEVGEQKEGGLLPKNNCIRRKKSLTRQVRKVSNPRRLRGSLSKRKRENDPIL